MHTILLSVLALARTLCRASPLACSPLSVMLTAPAYVGKNVLLPERWFICELKGDRFGGALDAAAKQFSKAFDSGLLPMEFVNKMKKDGKLIMGIGHRVKSVSSVFNLAFRFAFYYILQDYFCSMSRKLSKEWVCTFSDQQPWHARANSEGFCEATFLLHSTTWLRFRRREDHHFQGAFGPKLD